MHWSGGRRGSRAVGARLGGRSRVCARARSRDTYKRQLAHRERVGDKRGGSMDATATAPAPQHMRALERANRVRLARAELKRQVAESELTAAEVVLACPWEAESMSIAELLMSQHRWGRTRC